MTVTGPTAAPARAKQAGARVLPVPPPLYYGAAFAAGMLLRGLTVPLAIGDHPVGIAAGVVLLIIGQALALAGVVTVVRHRTTIVPHHAVTTLITTGVYRLSRNPMYTGLAITYLGGALLVDTWWPVAVLPLALVAVRRIAIDPEERYLADHFGPDYARYRSRTRRWL